MWVSRRSRMPGSELRCGPACDVQSVDPFVFVIEEHLGVLENGLKALCLRSLREEMRQMSFERLYRACYVCVLEGRMDLVQARVRRVMNSHLPLVWPPSRMNDVATKLRDVTLYYNKCTSVLKDERLVSTDAILTDLRKRHRKGWAWVLRVLIRVVFRLARECELLGLRPGGSAYDRIRSDFESRANETTPLAQHPACEPKSDRRSSLWSGGDDAQYSRDCEEDRSDVKAGPKKRKREEAETDLGRPTDDERESRLASNAYEERDRRGER